MPQGAIETVGRNAIRTVRSWIALPFLGWVYGLAPSSISDALTAVG